MRGILGRRPDGLLSSSTGVDENSVFMALVLYAVVLSYLHNRVVELIVLLTKST